MKPKTLILAAGIGLLSLVCASMLVRAQTAGTNQRSEAAIIKWDGTDRIQVLTPAKSEVIHVYKDGGQKMADIPEEEYCLTWVANKLMQQGWELVNLNNRRILMQRHINR